jgi:uncharacterized protein (UPF0332 family)
MELEQLKALSEVRLEHADECISAAKSLFESENFKSAANRAYYTVFHAMRAVLAFDKIDMKHHSGVIAEFRRLYIKTGIFDNELSKIISILSDSRNASDYDDFFVVSGEEVDEQIKFAERFLNEIKMFINSKEE